MAAVAINRLRWRCRRGMRELDLVLEGYLERNAHRMTDADAELFARFLESSDMDLYAWVTRRERPADAAFAALVDRLDAPASP